MRSGRTRTARPPRQSGVHESKFINRAIESIEAAPYQSKHQFSDFPIVGGFKRNIAEKGYVIPTPIQDQSIPLILAGKDLIGIANTGTGKTAAFLLPLMDKIYRNAGQRALIVAPTRELAVQINEEFLAFSKGSGLSSALCIGGAGMQNQIRSLQRKPHLVIGTPGRLLDHVRQRNLDLSRVQNVVLDEADRMVDMGFIKDIRQLISLLDSVRQSLFFSATISPEVDSLIRTFMKDPVTVSVKTTETPLTVDQDIVRFSNKYEKIELLHEHLNRDGFGKVLIFCRTKRNVERLCSELLERGFTVAEIHGNKSQPQRQKALKEFKEDRAKIMVATDVAARGLDIPDVTHVINYDAPDSYEDYVHRIGRTGRANKKGKALTFVG